MFASSAAHRTRSVPPAAGPVENRPGVIVELELPDRMPDNGRDGEPRPGLDPLELARAVRGLIHAIAPDLPAEVRVGFGPTGAPAPEGRPAVRAVPRDRFAPGSDPRAGRDRPGDGPGEPPGRTEPVLATAVAGDADPEDLQLDLLGRTLTVDGRSVVLTRREFDLLAYLRNRRGAAVTRRELMSGVWQTGYLTGDRTIDVHIRRLRMKLGSHAGRLATLRGYGYRLD